MRIFTYQAKPAESLVGRATEVGQNRTKFYADYIVKYFETGNEEYLAMDESDPENVKRWSTWAEISDFRETLSQFKKIPSDYWKNPLKISKKQECDEEVLNLSYSPL